MNSATIADCMSMDYARIHENMLVTDASSRLIKKALLGAPVTDEKGHLKGWISEQECLQVTIQVVYHSQSIALVKDVMRKDVLSVKLTDNALELAQQMLKPKPKIYPVVDHENKLIGVVTRQHMLAMLDKKLQEIKVSA